MIYAPSQQQTEKDDKVTGDNKVICSTVREILRSYS